ncbi:MAG: hypothetical protein F4133_05760, partial [Gammaproteobacteria bacterium]|nr:hypothetical protein [Gammaproteobacteria bacterium]
MRHIARLIARIAFASALAITSAVSALAHSDRGEKLPKTYAEAVIGWTKEELEREPRFRHPPGNVRAEDMRALFNNRVLVIDQGGKYNTVGAPN